MDQPLTPGAGEEPVRTRLDGDGVLLLTLNRPDRRNAWTPALEERYFAALERAVVDPQVRAVVITGSAGTWCPGMDMDVVAASSTGGPSPFPTRRPQTFVRLMPKLVVAAVEGACAGVGFVQALMCDVRFTTPESKWTAAFGKIGLNAEDGVAWVLERTVGLARATDLLLSCRVVLGEEAVRVGLATHLVEPGALLDQALAYARDVATRCSPLSVAMAKRALLASTTTSLEESRRLALQQLWEAKHAQDYELGVAAFRAGRRPDFPGLGADHGLLAPLPADDPAVERGGPRPP